MNHHGYGSDDRQFEDFRKQKSKQLRQRRLAEGQAGLYSHGYQNGAQRDVETNDQREAHDMQLRREMDEFVRDTTKLAAGVLGEVHDQKDREIQQQVSGEMSEFFGGGIASGVDESISGEFAALEEPAGFAAMSQQQRQVLSLQEHMDRQRELGEQASPEDLARLTSDAVAYVPPAEPTPVPPEAAGPRFHFSQTVASDEGQGEDYAEFRGDALSEFCELAGDVEELPDDDPDALDDSVREFERISHLEPSCTDDDIPSDGEDRSKRSHASVPKAFASLLLDPDRCKATLTCLVNGGLLGREDARAIYAEMKEHWAHCFDA